MKKYQRLSPKERWEIIKPIIEKETSLNSVSKKLGIGTTTINRWVRKYKESGMQGLENGKSQKLYSSDLKIQAVKDVIIRGMSKSSVTSKYEISDDSVLRRWITWYNNGKQLETTSSGRVGTIMIKGRVTTLEERIEIAQYTIARNLDYKSAMEKYDISYQQVYSWVNKYKDGGAGALKDNRGRNKAVEELSETELLKLRIKELEARNEYLEMESAIEKKLEELQRRYGNIR
jgi:transposase